MTPDRLALLVTAAALVGCIAAYAATRKLTQGVPKPLKGAGILVAWAGLGAALPYLVFAIGSGPASRSGQLQGASAAVLGLLPVFMVGAPIAGFVFALKHFHRHVSGKFSPDS